MAEPYEVLVFDRTEKIYKGEFSGVVELGRQRDAEESVGGKIVRGGVARVVVARSDENTVSRVHARIEPLGDGRCRVTNLSDKLPVRICSPMAVDLDRLRDFQDVPLPADFILGQGQKQVRIQAVAPQDDPGESLRTLGEATRRPGLFTSTSSSFLTQALPEIARLEPKHLVGWLQATLSILQSAAQGGSFFDKMAQDVIDFVGLDTGVLLEFSEDEGWTPKTIKAIPQVRLGAEWAPSQQVLRKVLADKRTYFQSGGESLNGLSMAGIKWVVAAPILDRENQVIGAIYGDRRPGSRPQSLNPITDLEASLVEYLAQVVAAGLDRVDQEKKVLEAQVKFAQFFGPDLASFLAENPDLLKGRDSEVTILFCDIRGFSSVAEKLGPARTVEWINDVMGTLSDCVLAHQGVLVDYIGDELMAMWGAPHDQPDQASLACRSALAMVETLEILNERWEPIIGKKMDVGIGINTGIARVGNTGSRVKFKYGPLGNTVNLASRVQGATKYLKTRLLITGATRTRLSGEFRTRRLCKVSVVNIGEPVDLYEVLPPDDRHGPELVGLYEQALDFFEDQQFHDAARLISQLVSEYRGDGALLLLMSRTADCLRQEPNECEFDPVWKLPGK